MSNTAATRASSFAVTCNLLSQYIKEKGRSLGDLGLMMPSMPLDAPAAKNATYRPPTTMSLLPGVDVTKEMVSDRNAPKCFPQQAGFGLQTPPVADKREAVKSQLTIFYGGKVLVFDNFPADKAKDLMMLAGKGPVSAKNTGLAPTPTAAPAEPQTLPSSMRPNAGFVTPASKPPAAVSNLPIARKASLHRFLEKRKDRISAKAPYQASKGKDPQAPPLVKPKTEEGAEPWLGLKPSLSSECSG